MRGHYVATNHKAATRKKGHTNKFTRAPGTDNLEPELSSYCSAHAFRVQLTFGTRAPYVSAVLIVVHRVLARTSLAQVPECTATCSSTVVYCR